MKDFFKYFLASLLAIVVSGLLLGIIFFGIVGAVVSTTNSQQVPVVKNNSILTIDLSKAISELPQNNILSAITGGSSGYSVGLFEATKSIEAAKKDDKIKGIYLTGGTNANAWATSQQIRNALKDFKTSGKFIIAYADVMSQVAYYVASVADSVFINPVGAVELKGLSTSIMFYKGLLDKLEVQPEIFYCGKFKSATEPMRASKMSAENRTQIAAYQADLWDQVLDAVQEHTQMTKEEIDSIVKLGLIQNSDDAITFKLADGLKYKDEVEDILREKLGISKKDDLNFASLSDYKGRLSQKPSNNQIALLIAQGNIVDGKAGVTDDAVIASDDFIAEIRKIRADSNIKAVVMRVNSPGGSALASENILRELQLLQKDKKLVVSMGDYAASGGYYIACSADSIFAMPNTITGSIGVFGIMMNTERMFNNKLGITFDVEKNAPLADLGSVTHPFSEREKEIIQKGVDTIYHTFKSRVANGRNLDINYVDSIGQGRVWTGTKALDLNLIDGLGGLDRATNAAAKLAGFSDYRVVVFPKSSSDLQRLMKLMNSSAQSNTTIQSLIGKQFGFNNSYAWQQINLMINYPKATWAIMPFMPETN
ncbi:MAG TPA: signal peptide peptidase SppA [Edaphocola sp.]|nr:signal peptide peptidase SppA [Edaphocola sp.]